MSWFRSLLARLPDWTPSFAELRDRNHAHANRFTRDEAARLIADDPILKHPSATVMRARILERIRAPLDPAALEECLKLLDDALRAQNYLSRPGTVEDVWILEGLLKRLSRQD